MLLWVAGTLVPGEDEVTDDVDRLDVVFSTHAVVCDKLYVLGARFGSWLLTSEY